MSRMICEGRTTDGLTDGLILVGNMRFRLLSLLLLLVNMLAFVRIRDRNNKKYREMTGGSLRSISLRVRCDVLLKPFKEESV